MSATRKRLALVVVAVILAPQLYVSSFISASFLCGAGIIPIPAFQFLCDTTFAPLYWIDGDTGRIAPLMEEAGHFYWLGFETRL